MEAAHASFVLASRLEQGLPNAGPLFRGEVGVFFPKKVFGRGDNVWHLMLVARGADFVCDAVLGEGPR